MFERLLKGMPRFAALSQLLRRQNLFSFKLGDPLLVSRHNRTVAGFDNAVEELVDLLFELQDVFLELVGRFGRSRQTCVPRILKHRFDKRKEPL